MLQEVVGNFSVCSALFYFAPFLRLEGGIPRANTRQEDYISLSLLYISN